MQFDGNELEKDDNNKPLDDGDNGAISWEDLLNMDDEDDLSSLVINSDDTKKEKDVEEKSNISDFDISTLSDENVLSKENFDINEAASNYVNSLDEEDIVVDNKELETNSNEQQLENKTPTEEEDILNVLADDGLLVETPEETIVNDDLSDVVDDELLSLLDEKNDSPSSYLESSLDDILEFNNNEEESEEKEIPQNVVDDTKEDLDNKPTAKKLLEEETTISEETSVNVQDEASLIEKEPVYDKQSKNKLILAISAGLVGLFAVIVVLVYFLFPNLAGNSNSDDLMTQDNTNYTMPDETQKDAVEMQKQTEELMNKLENKAENKQDDKEKKVVVAIQPSGRSNPFVPSSLFNEDGSLAMGADLSIPPDVDVNSPEVIAARKLFSIGVSGIMFDPNSPSAILKFDGNDYFVQKGDKIDTYTVKQITKDYVQIANGANVYKAYVGEIFKIGEIPQSKQMKYTSGLRQYVSADDIEISTK